MNKSNNSKSCSHFILVKNATQLKPIEWNNTNAKNKLRYSESTAQDQQVATYDQRKSVLNQIKHSLPKKSSSFHLNNRKKLQGFSVITPKKFYPQIIKSIQKQSSYKNDKNDTLKRYIIKNPQKFKKGQKVNAPNKIKFFKSNNIDNNNNFHQNKLQYQLDDDQILSKVQKAVKNKSKLIGVIFAKRYGLRFKLDYCFIQRNVKFKQQIYSQKIKKNMKDLEEMKFKKPLYYFHLNKQPVYKINEDLHTDQYVIIVNLSPILNLDFQILMKIFSQASKLEIKLKQAQDIVKKTYYQTQQNNTQIDDTLQHIYDWQRIKNIKKYVDDISQFPQILFQNDIFPTDSTHLEMIKKHSIIKKERNNITQNFLLETVNHYPQQTQNKWLLNEIGTKLEKFPQIKNPHIIKKFNKTDNIIQKVVRQKQSHSSNKIEKKSKNNILNDKSQKDYMWKLNRKNRILSSQNIPYIMQKYGMTRSQAYNVYNIYKSLQKISALRVGQTQFNEVYNKGLDRNTFNQGLYALQIIPGQDLINNICYYPKFISWEQFLKIVSVCLRKTPQQKLNAILQNIAADSQFINKKQVDAMVGSSLQKLLNENDIQLRQYFVSVVMQDLDKQKSGKISIKSLKDKVLYQKSDQMDIISFLMLNI